MRVEAIRTTVRTFERETNINGCQMMLSIPLSRAPLEGGLRLDSNSMVPVTPVREVTKQCVDCLNLIGTTVDRRWICFDLCLYRMPDDIVSTDNH